MDQMCVYIPHTYMDYTNLGISITLLDLVPMCPYISRKYPWLDIDKFHDHGHPYIHDWHFEWGSNEGDEFEGASNPTIFENN